MRNKWFSGSENIVWTNIQWHFETATWPWPWTQQSTFLTRHSGLWWCTIILSLVEEGQQFKMLIIWALAVTLALKFAHQSVCTATGRWWCTTILISAKVQLFRRYPGNSYGPMQCVRLPEHIHGWTRHHYSNDFTISLLFSPVAPWRRDSLETLNWSRLGDGGITILSDSTSRSLHTTSTELASSK